jgi:hypothetical protein
MLVFARWRADPNYRPANLVEWANRKKIDPPSCKLRCAPTIRA